MTEYETRILSALERIADALEAVKPKAKPKAELFEISEARAARGKKPARVMPEPFSMTSKHYEIAKNISRAEAEYQFSKFKAHHGAKGSAFVSWDQAWQTWVLNQMRFNGTAPQQPRPAGGLDGRI